MAFRLAALPYPRSALEPVISAQTIDFHYGKHHAGYVEKLNKLIEGTPYSAQPLEQVIQNTANNREKRAIFNNAAQVWNHDFFWRSMVPGGSRPGDMEQRIAVDFGSFDDFHGQFVKQAVGLFGSGWTWLVADGDRLRIVSTADAENPMTSGQHALIACDVWEHAYYLDYQNNREAFVRRFLEKLVNWEFAAEQLAQQDHGRGAAAEHTRQRKAR